MAPDILSRRQLLSSGWNDVTWEIYVTSDCNLRCAYCYNPDENAGLSEPRYAAADLLSFFNRYARKGDYLSFIGGEPLMRPQWIEKVMDATASFSFMHEIYTNGLNLGKLSAEFLNRFRTILVSIDGGEAQNDLGRGKGTFRRILRNIESIRPYYRGAIIARMTVTPENNLAESVRDILEIPHFDRIYWQYMNHAVSDAFPLERKWDELSRLLKMWLDALKQGKTLQLQTFIAMTVRLLAEENDPAFQDITCRLPGGTLACGAGHHYIQISPTGRIYACPELLEQDDACMGNLSDGVFRRLELADFPNAAKCPACPEFHICHCRCLHCTPEAYCILIKRTIARLRKALPGIKNLLANGTLNIQDFEIKEQLEEMF